MPSRPAKGLLLTIKNMDMVGSSISTKGMGSGHSLSQMVSPMVMSDIPETAMISPMEAESISARFRPWKFCRDEILTGTTFPSRLHMTAC